MMQSAPSSHQTGTPGLERSVQQAFRHCERIVRSHYENFPVASIFLPRELRPFIAAIYAFARTADDFADEGTLTAEQRLQELGAWEKKLDDCYEGKADHPIFIALAETAARYSISKQLLADLLTAFRMDVTQHRFPTFDDVVWYCRHSAHPIGRLLLSLFGAATERTMPLSDSLCTALQLANFWQDVTRDLQKGRHYFPLDDVERFGYTEDELRRRVVNDRFRRLMQFQVDRTRGLFEAGKPLVKEVVPNLRFELRLTWLGGMNILRKIEAARYDVLTQRPVNSSADKLRILTIAILRRTA